MVNTDARYLRISLLEHCNLRCFYCQPDKRTWHPQEFRDPEEFVRVIMSLRSIGVRKVRFTGGEPTLYIPLVELVRQIRSIDAEIDLALTSNGTRLKQLALSLADAGLRSVNISLDTVNRETFTRLTGKDQLSDVLRGIEAAIKYIPSVKLNCVVLAGVNDGELVSMVTFADSLGIDLRFIEYMPNYQADQHEQFFVAGSQVRASLPMQLKPIKAESSSAARYYRSSQLRIRIGFIESVSRPFCAGCDRIRLTSDGRLYGCLFSSENFNLFETLSAGEEIALSRVRQLISSKTRTGCIQTGPRHDYLPAFVNMGG